VGSGASVLVSAHDAERMIESLKQMELLDVGTVKWMDQHSYIEKLNLQVIKEGEQRGREEPPPPRGLFFSLSFLDLSTLPLPDSSSAGSLQRPNPLGRVRRGGFLFLR